MRLTLFFMASEKEEITTVKVVFIFPDQIMLQGSNMAKKHLIYIPIHKVLYREKCKFLEAKM